MAVEGRPKPKICCLSVIVGMFLLSFATPAVFRMQLFSSLSKSLMQRSISVNEDVLLLHLDVATDFLRSHLKRSCLL